MVLKERDLAKVTLPGKRCTNAVTECINIEEDKGKQNN